MKNEKIRIIKIAGAIVAYLIGSGFASGQEVMQFFTSYGPLKGFLGGIITMIVMVWCASTVLKDAEELKLIDANGIFCYYCGKYIGIVIEWLSAIFLYGIYVIMLSGAGTLLAEYYHLPEVVGRSIMLILSLVTVIFGLEKLTDIIGTIGPVIIVFTLLIGLFCIISNPSGIASSAAFVESHEMTKATPYWWLSGLNYGTFCSLTLIPYLSGLGKTIKDQKEATRAGSLGSFLFSFAAIILSFGMLAYIETVYDKSVPVVFLADMIIPGAGIVFSLVMYAGIYTTAVPMLWTSCNKIVHDEKSIYFKIVAIVLAIIAFFGGKLPFSLLVNTIYPYMGYIGMFVLICVLIKQIKKKQNKNN